MAERQLLNEEELELVSGGMMKFSGNHVMTYTHADGTVERFVIPADVDIVEAYKRSCVLHSQIINNEDQILSILQSEGIVGKLIEN